MTVGREGPKGGGRRSDPFPRQLHPLKQLSEIAPENEAATPLRAPELAVPTLAPGRRQRAQSGQRLLRHGRQVTRPPGQGREGGHSRGGSWRRAAGEVPRSGNFPGPGTAGGPGARRRSPASPSPPAAAYLAPRGRRGAHSRSGRRSVCCSGARSGRTRVALGGKGRGGSRGESWTGPRRAAGCWLGSAPGDDASPAPTRAGCRETRVGRRVLCIKAAVTSRGARDPR